MNKARTLVLAVMLSLCVLGCKNATKVVAHEEVLNSARQYAISEFKWDDPFVDTNTVIANEGVLVQVCQDEPVDTGTFQDSTTCVLITFDLDGNFVSATF